jgi:glycosyltransferase involved in cell wall biosynthesis
MPSVLHITPHLGGGVGRVILAWLRKDKDFNHSVLCLDYANEKAKEGLKEAGIGLHEKMASHLHKTMSLIKKADIVLIHWWNHPLLYDFLIRQTLPPVRVAMWSHVSGFYPPYVFTDPLLKYPDIFVFTTPLSMDTPEVKRASGDLRVIWSTAGTEHVKDVKPRPHEGFIVGYIGTVDYCKLHPNFLKMCAAVNVPDVHFVVCGGPCENEIRKEAESLGLGDKFTFTGPVDNIADYLSTFDVFGYPLNPMHYGTCDQSLVEAMAAGVPPVVLANPMEWGMVGGMITGWIAYDAHSYSQAIKHLYNNPADRLILSNNARKITSSRFLLDTMILRWGRLFEDLLKLPKTGRSWRHSFGLNAVPPHFIFIESLGDYVHDFERNLIGPATPNWTSKTRGTVHHYSSFFPKSRLLKRWSNFMGVTA